MANKKILTTQGPHTLVSRNYMNVIHINMSQVHSSDSDLAVLLPNFVSLWIRYVYPSRSLLCHPVNYLVHCD